jgi:O-antigen ligase
LQVDNSYLRIFLELGLLGIFSYLAMWALVLVGLLRRGADTLVNRYRAATAALVMGELARMAFSDTFTMFLSAPTFLVLVAIALRLRDRESVDGVR